MGVVFIFDHARGMYSEGWGCRFRVVTDQWIFRSGDAQAGVGDGGDFVDGGIGDGGRGDVVFGRWGEGACGGDAGFTKDFEF